MAGSPAASSTAVPSKNQTPRATAEGEALMQRASRRPQLRGITTAQHNECNDCDSSA
jgi:hypothetical protein